MMWKISQDESYIEDFGLRILDPRFHIEVSSFFSPQSDIQNPQSSPSPDIPPKNPATAENTLSRPLGKYHCVLIL